jgi:hypothetical protein
MSKAKRTIVDAKEDPLNGNYVLWLSDGEAICLERRERDLCEMEWWLDSMSIAGNGERVDVIQYGRRVGELPDYWHPGLAKSASPFFDYRPGDLVKQDGKWVASPTLGARDLDCLIGFVRKPCAQGDTP